MTGRRRDLFRASPNTGDRTAGDTKNPIVDASQNRRRRCCGGFSISPLIQFNPGARIRRSRRLT